MTDSINPEAWYFSAILNARNNNPSATKKDILKAVEYGFTDKNGIAKQSEFKNLGTQINFRKIQSKMK